MLCCGNDIVDLKSPEALRKGDNKPFVARVLTALEEEALRACGLSDRVLWLLWAAKEAAYKVVSKTRRDLPFIPRLFQVRFPGLQLRDLSRSSMEGIVESPGGVVAVKAWATDDYVHVVGAASRTVLEQVVAGESKPWGKTGETALAEESKMARRFALAALAKALETEPSALEIRRFPTSKGLGPPVVYHENKPAAVDLSLSHHGRYVSYAFITYQIFAIQSAISAAWYSSC